MGDPLYQQNHSCGSSQVESSSFAAGENPDPAAPSSCGIALSFLLLQYAIGSLLIFIIFLSISGNILVCIAIYTDRRLRKLGNLFLASLALADLFLAALVMTFAVANDMMGYWMFGDNFCEIWISFDVMCCTASILNLAAISLDRFFHIKDPLLYERWMTKKVILTSVTGIWLLSGLVSFVPISLGWHRPVSNSLLPPDSPELHIPEGSSSSPLRSALLDAQDGDPTAVTELRDSQDPGDLRMPQCSLDLTPLYAVVSSAISFYIPCLIMIALYTRLYLYAKKHVRNIRSVTKTVQYDQEKCLTTASGEGNYQSVKHHHVSEHKAAITLGVIMGTFLFCWVPFFIINIIDAYCKTCIPALMFKILTWLGYFNSAMNPVIYSIFNTEFRDAFRRILISYARNECCDRRRESRGATDLLVGNRGRCSTSDAAFPHHQHLQQQRNQSKVRSCLSSQSLNHHHQQQQDQTACSAKLHQQAVSGNHSNRSTPALEVLQEKNIELTFFPPRGSGDKRQQISAI